jgi:phospholipid/cholesterol/gamma-HCH transport system permease protein
MLPLLTIIADFIGMIGGFAIANTQLGITSSEYWTSAWQILEYNDIAQGLIKPFTFAIIIALVGCFYGMRTTGGTQGVGRATTDAVVWSSLWIIIANAVITQFFVSL